MSIELAVEIARIQRDLGRVLAQGSVLSESPIRIHGREVDSGGAPEYHPSFLRYLDNFSVCHCGRPAMCASGCRATRPDEHLATCERACPTSGRFRASDHKSNPNRLSRAFRMVRKHNSKSYDITFLTWGRSWSYQAAVDKLRAGDVARGLPERTDQECLTQWVSGSAMLSSAF